MLFQIPTKMKKLILLIQLALYGVVGLNGQTSSMIPDSIIYITPEDEVYMKDKQAKYLWKLGNDLAFEFKIGKAFSMEIELFPDNFSNFDLNRFGLGVSLGTRYYYQMSRRVKAGKQASNLSGKYISLSLGPAISFVYNEFTEDLISTGFMGYSLGIGMQQRYLQYEYFDYRLSLDYNTIPLSGLPGNGSSISLRTQSSYGFSLGKKHYVDKENLCPVIKCYTDRKSGFKIIRDNFFSLTRSSFNNNNTFWNLAFRPRIGYEFKIMNSSFSIAQDAGISLGFNNIKYEDSPMDYTKGSFALNEGNYFYRVGGRYYFNMNRKILAGEQGNNLSGFYINLMFEHSGNWNSVPGQPSSSNRGSLLAGIGRQAEITGRLFLDAQATFGARLYGSTTFLSLIPNLDFSIGYMF